MSITAITKQEGKLEDDKFCRLYWNEKGQSILTGAKIVHTRYMTKSESDAMGWYHQPIALLLEKDGKEFWVYPSCDDEGNDAGALFMNNKEGCMPVMRER
jgi:hypothetical protein